MSKALSWVFPGVSSVHLRFVLARSRGLLRVSGRLRVRDVRLCFLTSRALSRHRALLGASSGSCWVSWVVLGLKYHLHNGGFFIFFIRPDVKSTWLNLHETNYFKYQTLFGTFFDHTSNRFLSFLDLGGCSRLFRGCSEVILR